MLNDQIPQSTREFAVDEEMLKLRAYSVTVTIQLWCMQAQVMLSEIYPGNSPKIGSTYWDQIREVAVISVIKRVLKRLQEQLEQVSGVALGDEFSNS
ncbi:hypothetical protein HAX54_048739 [Datura stramonium]|uniref:Uncharacterized protein n=1 Tax=Datura stramonium TaxID=4076 RepID=A0ABS8WLI8_DATST|nr:hypothetical protein [Datura stramonium]